MQHDAFITQQTDKADGLDTVTTQCKEVVDGTDGLVIVQHVGKQSGNLLLRLVSRLHIFHIAGQHGRRQCFSVHLAIRCQRHSVKLYVGLGNHIVCQLLSQEALQTGQIHLIGCCEIETQVLGAIDVAHLGGHILNTLVALGNILYLTHLNTESAQLHLVVNTSQELQLSFIIIAGQVTSAVHGYAGYEGTLSKLLCCQVFAFPIASGNLRA